MFNFIAIVVLATTVFACTRYFGRDVGAWVAIALFGLAWVVLKLVTDWQERQLQKDLEDLTDKEYEGFLDDAEEAGLVKRRPKE